MTSCGGRGRARPAGSPSSESSAPVRTSPSHPMPVRRSIGSTVRPESAGTTANVAGCAEECKDQSEDGGSIAAMMPTTQQDDPSSPRWRARCETGSSSTTATAASGSDTAAGCGRSTPIDARREARARFSEMLQRSGGPSRPDRPSVADLGCGFGALSLYFAVEGAGVLGVDPTRSGRRSPRPSPSRSRCQRPSPADGWTTSSCPTRASTSRY